MKRPVALITGGTSGIGFDTAKKLAATHDLFLVYRDRHSDAEKALAQFPKEARVEIFSADLQLSESAKRIADEALKRFEEPVTVLVNSAGLSQPNLFLEQPFDYIDTQVVLNLTSVMKLTQLILPGMYRRKYGRIVSVSSYASGSHVRGHLLYSVAKAGIEEFTRKLALEVYHRGITVNAVKPHFTRTRMIEESFSDYKDLLERLPEVLIPVEDVSALILHFLGPHGKYISGSIFEIGTDAFDVTISKLKREHLHK
jgi:3-oxoacyl-[acyl-carrier protein] reductase